MCSLSSSLPVNDDVHSAGHSLTAIVGDVDPGGGSAGSYRASGRVRSSRTCRWETASCPGGMVTRDVLDGPGNFGGRRDGDGNSKAGRASAVSNGLLFEARGGGSVAGSARVRLQFAVPRIGV
jgi:hypothetical protein